MGCGQSKINIYPKKSKGKNSSKKAITGDKQEGEVQDGAENEQDTNETSGVGDGADDCDSKKKPARTKPIGHVGGPLLAQTELSNSQQNFFKMLDDKIDKGPDYDSNDETEMALETARLHSLLKDWETASSSSRSLPSTPRHVPRVLAERPTHSAPKTHTRIPPNVIHQGYGVTPAAAYRQSNYNPAYQTHSPTHYYPNVSKVQPGIQYQDYNTPNFNIQPQGYALPRQYSHPLPSTIPNTVPSSANTNNSPKHKYPQTQAHSSVGYIPQNSPTHKIYITPQNQNYTNGELIIQQQLYNQQIQYQQSREYQQYRQNREQLLVQQQMCGPAGVPPAPPVVYGAPPPSRGSHYQSSVHVPIVAVLPQPEPSPKMSLQRKQQRQYSQET